jgi:8-oxo-dGTP pyrophosphatase MutT (NUDIX family)
MKSTAIPIKCTNKYSILSEYIKEANDYNEKIPSPTLKHENKQQIDKQQIDKQQNKQDTQDARFDINILQNIQKDKIKQKYSWGIACVRKNPTTNIKEILLIQKRYTYAFHEFVHGKYIQSNLKSNKYLNDQLIKLFNNMTVNEKIDILSCNFDQMWYRVWLDSPKPHIYYQAKNKFETTFLFDKGEKLKKIIGKTNNVQLIWEIPKGRRKNKFESNLQCAIREFNEETNIDKKNYKILPNLSKIYSHIDDNIQYINHYFIANYDESNISKHNKSAIVDISKKEQIGEICNIKWVSLNSLRIIDEESPNNNKLYDFTKNIFKACNAFL